MKRIFVLLTFIFLICVSSFAQNKIAVVDVDAFHDEKLGINELVIALKKLEVEFEPIFEQISSIVQKSDKSIAEKTLSRLVDGINPQFRKRKTEIVEPVFKRVIVKLDVFKKNKNYLVIFDKKIFDELALADPYPDDVTKEFIKFCNEEFEKEKAQKK